MPRNSRELRHVTLIENRIKHLQKRIDTIPANTIRGDWDMSERIALLWAIEELTTLETIREIMLPWQHRLTSESMLKDLERVLQLLASKPPHAFRHKNTYPQRTT